MARGYISRSQAGSAASSHSLLWELVPCPCSRSALARVQTARRQLGWDKGLWGSSWVAGLVSPHGGTCQDYDSPRCSCSPCRVPDLPSSLSPWSQPIPTLGRPLLLLPNSMKASWKLWKPNAFNFELSFIIFGLLQEGLDLQGIPFSSKKKPTADSIAWETELEKKKKKANAYRLTDQDTFHKNNK